jgi:hypothetical protein
MFIAVWQYRQVGTIVYIKDPIYTSSATVCSLSTAGVSLDVSADAGFLCYKAAVIGDTIKGTLCITYIETHKV